MDNENIIYGRLTEAVHISGYSLERAMGEFKWLIEENRWKKVGAGFEDINEFLKTINFSEFKIAVERRIEIANKLAELQASQRATARMLGVNNTTIHNDLKQPVEKSTPDKNTDIDFQDVTEVTVENSTPPSVPGWIGESGR